MSNSRFRIQEKGFTLVELMIVILIIGILAAIAVPLYNSVSADAKRTSVEANLRTIDGAINSYKADNDEAATKDLLMTAGGEYLNEWPSGPDGVEYDVSDDGTRAIISQESSGAWFTTEDVSLPITW